MLSSRDYLRQKKKEGYELISTPFIYILKAGFPQERYKFILLAELPSLHSCQGLIRLLLPREFLVFGRLDVILRGRFDGHRLRDPAGRV